MRLYQTGLDRSAMAAESLRPCTGRRLPSMVVRILPVPSIAAPAYALQAHIPMLKQLAAARPACLRMSSFAVRQPSQVGQRRPIKQAQAQSTCCLQQQLQGRSLGSLRAPLHSAVRVPLWRAPPTPCLACQLNTGEHIISKVATISLSSAPTGQRLTIGAPVDSSISDHESSDMSGESAGDREHDRQFMASRHSAAQRGSLQGYAC